MTPHPCKDVVAGARVVDGTGKSASELDVFIIEGWIDDVRPHTDSHPGWHVIDASGLTLAPGFIDVHSHGDNAPLLDSDDTSKILQGVTTEVVGNCGFSLAPSTPRNKQHLIHLLEGMFPTPFDVGYTFADLLRTTDRRGYVTNYAPLIGHNALRIAAMGMDRRAPTKHELKAMEGMVDEAIDSGAFGLSTGLIYSPGSFSQTDEIASLAKRLPPDRIYTSHIRGEAGTLMNALSEALEVGKASGCRVQISHHKAMGSKHWGKTTESLALLEDARPIGVDVWQDVYPYVASATVLKAVLPQEFHEGGTDKTLARLADQQQLARLRQMLESDSEGFESFVSLAGYDRVVVSSTESRRYEGMSLTEIAREIACSPFEALIHVLVSERLKASMIFYAIDESDVQRILLDEHTVIGTDGASPGLAGKHHPRTYGTFPRVLSRYVREFGTLSLEQAVKRMTSLPAQIFRLGSRGAIARGQVADLVAFDASSICDDLDYGDPQRAPKGIAWVMVRGHRVVEGDKLVGGRKGLRLTPI